MEMPRIMEAVKSVYNDMGATRNGFRVGFEGMRRCFSRCDATYGVELRHRHQPQVDQSMTRGTLGCVAATHVVAACRVAALLRGFGTPARCDGAGGGFHQRAGRSTAAPRGAGSLHREDAENVIYHTSGRATDGLGAS
jgi:hypothetical protein